MNVNSNQQHLQKNVKKLDIKKKFIYRRLKGHGNEPDFPRFLH
jgi:hypothetical protein